MIAYAKALGARVTVISPTPTFGLTPLRRVVERVSCEGDFRLVDAITGLTAEHPEMRLLDFTAYLCRTKRDCPEIAQGGTAYIDPTHLSNHGSRSLVPELGRLSEQPPSHRPRRSDKRRPKRTLG